MYFETTIKGSVDAGDGLLKNVTLRLFVEAETFAEAEEKSYTYWEGEGVTGMELTGCKKSGFLGVVGVGGLGLGDGRGLFKFVTEMSVMDDRGKEKKIRESWLIGAEGIEDAEDIGRRKFMDVAPFPIKLVELKITSLDAVYED